MVSLAWHYSSKRESADQPHYKVSARSSKNDTRITQSTVSIVALVAMAVTMQYAGNDTTAGEVFSANTGQFSCFQPFHWRRHWAHLWTVAATQNGTVVFGSLQMQYSRRAGVVDSRDSGMREQQAAQPAAFCTGNHSSSGVSHRERRRRTGCFTAGDDSLLAILFILGIATWFAA